MSTFDIAIEQLYGIILTTKLQADLSANLLAGQLTFGTLISAVDSRVDDDFRCQNQHSGCCSKWWRQARVSGVGSRVDGQKTAIHPDAKTS